MAYTKKDIITITKNGQDNIFTLPKYEILDSSVKYVSIDFKGSKKNLSRYLSINGIFEVDINSKVLFEVNSPTSLNIELHSPMDECEEFEIIFSESKKKFADAINFVSNDVLMITSDFPSNRKPYSNVTTYCADKYFKEGIIPQIAVVNNSYWYETSYKYKNYDVFKGNANTIKEILLKQIPKTIVFNDLIIDYLWLIDGYTNKSQKIYFRVNDNIVLDNLCFNKNNYFYKESLDEELIKEKDELLKKLSEKENIFWIFESKTLSKQFEKKYNLKNIIYSSYYFPVNIDKCNKTNDLLVFENFSNNQFYHVDETVRIIKKLSDYLKNKFPSTEVNAYSNVYEDLLKPLNGMQNVTINYQTNSYESLTECFAKSKSLITCSDVYLPKYVIDYAKEANLLILNFSKKIKYNEKNILNIDSFEDLIDNLQKTSFSIPSKKAFEGINDEIQSIKTTFNLNDTPKYKKAKKPVLTIVIPSYNVENYLMKCLNSLIYCNEINNMEILVINDGSIDKTHDVGKYYEKLTNGVVKLIDKENGGHGSAVNLGMKLAKGKYFKILDSDDWFNSDNLDTLVSILKTSKSDLILNKVRRDYAIDYHLDVITEYDYLVPYYVYSISDIILENYGLKSSAIFAAYIIKTDILRKANFNITEKKLYADHEFDSLMLKYVETVEYIPICIYMYLIGREGQSISSNIWKQRYKDHQNALFTLLDKLTSDKGFPADKKEFISRINLAPMVAHQINSMYEFEKYDEINGFIQRLNAYNDEYCTIKKEIIYKNMIKEECMEFIKTDGHYFVNDVKKQSYLRKVLRKIKRIFHKKG